MFVGQVKSLPLVSLQDAMSGSALPHKQVRVQYSSEKDFEVKAKQLKIMSDWRVCCYT